MSVWFHAEDDLIGVWDGIRMSYEIKGRTWYSVFYNHNKQITSPVSWKWGQIGEFE